MLRTDRDALICDLAETYGIFDLHAVPLPLLATLACGLREDSRIMMRLSGRTVSSGMLLQAAMLDRLSVLVWSKTKDAQKGHNPPKSVLDTLLTEVKKAETGGFATAEDFEATRKRITSKRK